MDLNFDRIVNDQGMVPIGADIYKYLNFGKEHNDLYYYLIGETIMVTQKNMNMQSIMKSKIDSYNYRIRIPNYVTKEGIIKKGHIVQVKAKIKKGIPQLLIKKKEM